MLIEGVVPIQLVQEDRVMKLRDDAINIAHTIPTLDYISNLQRIPEICLRIFQLTVFPRLVIMGKSY